MTALFDLGVTEAAEVGEAQRLLDATKADLAFTSVLSHARDLGGRAALKRLQRYRDQIAAVESEIGAAHVGDDGDTRQTERLFADNKTSKREQRKKANRAKAVAKNNDLAAKMASGAMSEEQVDVIADASAKSDGAAAVDADLIDKVSSVPPEQGKSHADDFLADRATADGVQSEHDRQRALRRASKYNSKKNNLDTISIEGDGVAIKAMWDAIEARADQLYKADGGRDLPLGKHPRTNNQRKFDAAHELITSSGLPTTNSNAESHNGDNGNNPAGSAGSKRHTPPKPRPQAARPRIVIGLTIDKLSGRDPAAVAIQHGLGLIPDSVLADYAANADIMAALYDRTGQPLWLGRLHRYATQTQMIALILRDRHCVLCGADHTRCQAHHTMPWHAPGQGRTDLDDLVLLCSPCHTQLHADQRTIYQDHQRTWRTRPATADELPPPRPARTRNLPKRE